MRSAEWRALITVGRSGVAAESEAEPLSGHAGESLLALGELRAELGRPVEVAGHVGAMNRPRHVDEPPGVASPPGARCVETFEAEADRIHQLVTTGARRIRHVIDHRFAPSLIGLLNRRNDVGVRRRGREPLTEKRLAYEDAAMRGRRVVAAGIGG